MGGNDFLVAIVAIGCGTGIVWMFFETVKTAFVGRRNKKQEELVEEVRALRQEVAALRQQNNDLILNFDTTLSRVDRRVEHLETRTHIQAANEQAQRVGQLR